MCCFDKIVLSKQTNHVLLSLIFRADANPEKKEHGYLSESHFVKCIAVEQTDKCSQKINSLGVLHLNGAENLHANTVCHVLSLIAFRYKTTFSSP